MLKSIAKKYRFLLKPFLILLGLYFLCFLPLFRANYYYVDDLYRNAEGFQGWENFSRFTSNFLSVFLHTNSYLADNAPLSQIIAIIMMAAASTLLLYIISDKKKFSIWQICGALILGIFPMFLENISYRYDAPFMALSVLAAIVPFLFFDKKPLHFIIAIFISSLLICTTYQVSFCIMLTLFVFLTFIHINSGKKIKSILKSLGLGVVSMLVAMIIFRLFILQPIITYNPEVNGSFASFSNLIPTFAENIKKYFTFSYYAIFTFLPWGIISLIICALFVVLAIKNSARPKPLVFFFITLVVFPLLALSSFGFYLFLEKPLVTPRSVYGVGAVLSILCIYITSQKSATLSKLFTTALTWCFIVFSFIYSNVLSQQAQYTDYRITNLIAGMNDLEIFATEETKTVYFDGKLDYAPTVRGDVEAYPALKYLVPIIGIGGGEDWDGHHYTFFRYYDVKNLEYGKIPEDVELITLKDSMLYRIDAFENYVKITIK